MEEKNIALYYIGGGSDKVYNVALVNNPGGWGVNFSYGRRGTSLNAGTKTASSVSYSKALEIYDKLVASKRKKGYEIDELKSSAATKISVVEEKETIDVLPQLLNAITLEQAEKLINDDNWMMQEKEDGRRRLIAKSKDKIVGANRKGEIVGIETAFKTAVGTIPYDDCTLDGEDLGSEIVLFDVVLHNLPCHARYEILKNLFEQGDLTSVFRLSKAAFTTEEKRELFDKVKAEGGEGLVFKRKDSPYVPGRPKSGGDQLKFKFTETCTCMVIEKNIGKKSIKLGLFEKPDSTSLTYVGNATVYANIVTPEAGDLVEIQYLYAYKGGSLYQPVLLGVRDDLSPADCQMSQLKYKKE